MSLVREHPANRGRGGRALLRSCLWQLYKRTLRRTYDWRHPRGYRLRVWPDSPAADLALFTGGYPDWHAMRLVERVLRPGDRFVDVGADVGVWTLCTASAVGPTGRVFAFEATPAARERLQSNLAINGFTTRVEVRTETLSDESRELAWPLDRGPQNDRPVPRQPQVAITERPTARFDDVLADESPFAARIGHAGAERVLLGASQALSRGRPALWVLELDAGDECPAEDLARRFAQHGYDLGAYDESTQSLHLGDDRWRMARPVIALARNAVDELRRRAPAIEIHGLPRERSAA